MKFTELYPSEISVKLGNRKIVELTRILKLQTPLVIIYEDGMARWGVIDKASGYRVKINNSTIHEVTNNEYKLSVNDSIEVQAMASYDYTVDSDWSIVQTYYGTYSQGLEFISNGNGTCYVSGIGNCKDSLLRIPTTHNNERVISIGRMAFIGCAITGLVIPGGITNIGEYAFRKCLNLSTIAISNTVTSIGDYAFYGCRDLTTLIVPTGVISIGTGSFQNCIKLTSIELSGTVDTIGRNAFMGCTSLRSITIPEGLRTIKRNAFQDCSKLIEIKLARSVSTLESAILLGCTNLKGFTIPQNIDNLGDAIFSKCTNIEEVVIESASISRAVKTIGSRMFHECNSLQTVSIPIVSEIGKYAFYNCRRLSIINYGGDEKSWSSIYLGKDWDTGAGDYVVKYVNTTIGG